MAVIEALVMVECQPGNTNIDQILRSSHHVDRGSDQSLDRVIRQHGHLLTHMRYRLIHITDFYCAE